MTTTRLAWVGIFLLASVFTVGCTDNKVKALEDRNQQLMSENASLQASLNTAQENETAMRNQLAAKEQELAAARSGAKVAPPVTNTTAEGWEKGLVGDRVSLATDILFAPGEAKLTDQGKHKLDQIAATLKSTYKGLAIRVYGYTDNDPIRRTKNLWEDNLDLSANRSMAVSRYLWGKGIAKEHLETVAMGQTHFLASNANKATKAKNRRVEIVVIKK